MTASSTALPRLRPVDIRPIEQRGQMAFLLRDPLRLSDQAVVVPRFLGPALMLCDGLRDVSAICATLAHDYGLMLTEPVIEELLVALDDALLLETSASCRPAPLRLRRTAPSRFARCPTLAWRILMILPS